MRWNITTIVAGYNDFSFGVEDEERRHDHDDVTRGVEVRRVVEGSRWDDDDALCDPRHETPR